MVVFYKTMSLITYSNIMYCLTRPLQALTNSILGTQRGRFIEHPKFEQRPNFELFLNILNILFSKM